ncbi:hypothetical protein IWX49DRAFT_564151 [Phyllosticta citricarpa]|uniref:Uncharacterized protein n=2 Tax=Phyllosticta TaxID=121621 RepID=A0ABR1MJ64_9PEZI
MYRNRNDPRFRRTLDELSHNIESANEAAQEGIYTFSHNYVHPCFYSVTNCFQACWQPCFGSAEARLRRRRGRGRGRAELNFDFYDDWDNDDDEDEPFGRGNSEFDRLLAGQGTSTQSQPGRQRAMSYGARRGDKINHGRRKSAVPPHYGDPDPTLIPTSSYFGFLSRLPWKVGGRALRYKPSAADLQEHPGQARRSIEEEQQPLIEDADEYPGYFNSTRRKRSKTTGSGHTADSLSSRGDILPSEDELDDAVPLDDEFSLVLERRNTGVGHDDHSNSSTRALLGRMSHGSRISTRTVSSKSTAESRRKSAVAPPADNKQSDAALSKDASMSDLKLEEARVQQQEEEAIERKLDAAMTLALKRGLKADDPVTASEDKLPIPSPTPSSPRTAIRHEPASPHSMPQSPAAVPFPTFESHQAATIGSPTGAGKPPHANTPQQRSEMQGQEDFIPARLPHFQSKAD